MSNRTVAARALQPFSLAVHNVAVDGRSNVLVAAAAGILRHFVVEAGDLDGIGVVAAGEIEGMPETVVDFDGVFANQIVRRVTIVAGSGSTMTGFDPGIVLRLHDVAVRTSGRVVREIRISLGINERVAAQSNDHAR